MTILDRLSIHEREEKRAARISWQFTRYSAWALSTLGFSIFLASQNMQAQPKEIGIKLLERTASQGPIKNQIALNYFRKNPHLIDQLPDEKKVMKTLEELVLKYVKRESITPPIKPFPVPAKFTVRDSRTFRVTADNRAKLEGIDSQHDYFEKDYFSRITMKKPSILIKHTNYVFFPKKSWIFKLEGVNVINPVMYYVRDLIQIPGGAYFVQGDKKDKAVVSIAFNGKPKVVYECIKECRVYKVHGTPYGVVFDGKKVKLLDGIDQTRAGEKLKSKTKNLLTDLIKKHEFEPDDYTRVLWRNNTLYVNNDNDVWIYKEQLSKWHNISPSDASAFYVFDMDGDGRDEIAIMACPLVRSNRWVVYQDKKQDNAWTKSYTISGAGSECKQDFYKKPDHTHLWLAPTLLKQELKKIVKK